MAATEKGVWDLQEVRDKQLAGEWSYDGLSQLFTQGHNNSGTLGQNDRTYRSSPTQVTGSWVASASSSLATLAIKSDNTMWVWGGNDYGQLGLNSNANFSSPVQIDGSWVTVSSCGTSQHSVAAIKTDGTLWAWGTNEYGQLGINKNPSNFDFISSPTQVGTDTTWSTSTSKTMLSMGSLCIAVKTDGTLWTWGFNNGGGLGQNNQTQRSSPVQVPGTTWSSVGHVFTNMMAFKTDGTMWTAGTNGYGELGIGSRTQYSSPKQVPGTTWKAGVNNDNWAGATKTDGTLWTWGRNGQGQLGQNDSHSPGPESKLDPTQVPGTTWDTLQAAGTTTFANKTDGTVWSWGNNNYGILGLNQPAPTKLSSPTQIPGTTWTSFTRNGSGGFAANLLTSA